MKFFLFLSHQKSIFLLLLIFSFSPNVNVYAKLTTQGPYLVDKQGRVVLLRGFNLTGDAKIPPFRGIQSPSQLDPLVKWGANVIRLLFIWEAYELLPGIYDEDYLSYYKEILDWSYERDLQVIVDIHQDGFSRFTLGGCGEGFPKWTLDPSIKIRTPRNDHRCKNWAFKMFLDFDMMKSWKSFYSDKYGSRTRYLQLLQKLAETLRGHPAVLGYDLLNEPWGDEVKEISPLYQEASDLIRQIDPEILIFTTPHMLVSSGQINSRLLRPKGSQIVYAPHYYNPFMYMFKRWTHFSLNQDFARMKRKAASWQVPLFLGEFGAEGSGRFSASYMKALYGMMDENFVSGAQWNYTPLWNAQDKDGWNREDYSIVDEEGRFRKNFELRPYVRKVAGLPISNKIKFNSYGKIPYTYKLSFSWKHEPKKGMTEIFVPLHLQMDQVLPEFSMQEGECHLVIERQTLLCSSPTEGLKKVEIWQKKKINDQSLAFP